VEPAALHGLLRASAEGSTLKYNSGRIEVGPHWLSAGYSHDWRPQDPLFGIGMDAREDDATSYATETRRAEARVRWRRGTTLRREVGAWVGERRVVVRPGRDSRRPSFETRFPGIASGAVDAPQDHVVSGARVALDTRSGRPHWSQGWRLAGQVDWYAHPWSGRGMLFRGGADSPAFTRTTVEGETGFSFMRDPRTLRLGARVVDTHAADASRPPGFIDMQSLGGSAGLYGFEPGRYRGSDLALVRLSYVFPLARHSEFELSTERGGVFEDVWGGARLDQTKASYGVSFRIRTDNAPLGAVGVNWSNEAVRFHFSLGGVE
jgi:hypothetical protein